MIIVSGSLYVSAAERETYLESCRIVIEQARNAPGCLDFVISGDPLEPDRINVYERWESDADVELFRGNGPAPEQLAAIREARVAKYRISATEAP